MATTAPRKIMIPMDLSKRSKNAFDWYLKIFYRDRDDVLVVYVSETERGGPTTQTYGQKADKAVLATDPQFVDKLAREDEDDVIELMKWLKETIILNQIKGRCLRVMSLHRGEAIIEASDANKIDVIVMGTREAGVAGRGVAQSTTVYVSHNSRMPALLVRGHEMEEAPGKK